MQINRPSLLKELIAAKHDGFVKILTGIRRRGKKHLMENTIFNELKRNGYIIDVGVVCLDKIKDGKHVRTNHEIDFGVNRGYDRIYIQSAWMIPDDETRTYVLK